MSDKSTVCQGELLQKVLKQGEVQTFYQPVVAVDRMTIIGFEAYARGALADDQVIKPQVLFDQCHDLDTLLHMDRLCRESALRNFQSIFRTHPNMLLFLNINITALKAKSMEINTLQEQVEEYGYDPRHVVIEVEEKLIDDDAPMELLTYYKNLGMHFSIDDVGTSGYALDKMFLVRPGFIKLNRNFLSEVKQKPYKADVLASLQKAAQSIGAVVVGKGVEKEEDAFALLDNKVMLQQGYYYTKTKDDNEKDATKIFKAKIMDVNHRYKESMSMSIRKKKATFEDYHKLMSKLLFKVEKETAKEFPARCRAMIQSEESIMGLFILNDQGLVVSNRFLRYQDNDAPKLREERATKNYSLSDFFVHLRTGFEKFVTPPFSSPLTRQQHCIIARRFLNVEGREFVMCLEFAYPL